MKYLATEKVNRGRQPEIDCLKAFCIVFMILLHAYEECAEEPGGFYNVLVGIEALTGAGAFMICMGLGMRYSRRQSPKDDLTRGFALLTVSQLLNLLRDSLPCLIAYWGTGRQIFLATALLIVQTDILTFAGFAFLLIALLRHLKLSDGVILGLGFGLNVAAFALSGVFRTTGNYLLDQLLGFFLVTDAEAYFPLGCYFVFVAFGYALGGLYLRIKDKDALSTRVLLVCGPIAAVYYALRFTVPFPLLPDFFSIERYVMTPATDAVALCLMTLCVLSLFHKLLRLGGGEPPRFVKHLSGHINQYYCVSYVFISPMNTRSASLTLMIAARLSAELMNASLSGLSTGSNLTGGNGFSGGSFANASWHSSSVGGSRFSSSSSAFVSSSPPDGCSCDGSTAAAGFAVVFT